MTFHSAPSQSDARIMRCPRVFTYTLMLALLAQSAFGGPSNIDARREAYRKGYAALEAKNWDEAYRIFKQLWLDQPAYDVALNLGQAELRLHKYRDAAEHLAFATTHFPAAEDKEVLDRGLKGLEQAKREIGRLILVVDRSGAAVRVDGNTIGTTPIDGEIFVDPGEHAVEASLAGFVTAAQPFQVTAGQSQTVVLKLDAAPPSNAALPSDSANATASPVGTSSDSPHKQRNYTAPIVAASIGGAALVSGISFLIVSSNKQSAADDRASQLGGENPCAPGIDSDRIAECQKISNLAQSATTFRTLAFVGFGAAAGAGIATFVLWPRSHSDVAGNRFVPSVSFSQHGAFATVRGAF